MTVITATRTDFVGMDNAMVVVYKDTRGDMDEYTAYTKLPTGLYKCYRHRPAGWGHIYQEGVPFEEWRREWHDERLDTHECGRHSIRLDWEFPAGTEVTTDNILALIKDDFEHNDVTFYHLVPR